MKRYTTKIRRISSFAAAVLLLGALLSLASCSRPPKADEIRADVIALVEASYELNEVFLGAGLPVLDRSNEEYAYTYSAAPATVNTYDIIDVDRSPFRSIEEIKAAAERVYSPDLLETNLYVNAFVGQAITDLGAKVTVVDARYTEDADCFYQSRSAKNYFADSGRHLFDYDTLRVIRPSTANKIIVTMDSWYTSDPANVQTAQLRLVKTASGWRLDSLTV